VLKRNQGEIIANLEQLRFLENNIPIKLVYTSKNSYGINTLEDFKFVKDLMESKIRKDNSLVK
jgi:3-deoxy-manno-octulosonate cytidylyltransferase (CMP-KDO synthetase)